VALITEAVKEVDVAAIKVVEADLVVLVAVAIVVAKKSVMSSNNAF
jgi:hypothetical protein